MTRENEIKVDIERRIANEKRIYAKRRADALAVVDAQILYRRIYGCTDQPKSYGSPWMEGADFRSRTKKDN